jgi:putative acetyltransferase
MRAGLELADNWLNLTRLELEVYSDNESGVRLYERFGFEREGTLRQHAFRDGRYVDSYVMARLRPSDSVT